MLRHDPKFFVKSLYCKISAIQACQATYQKGHFTISKKTGLWGSCKIINDNLGFCLLMETKLLTLYSLASACTFSTVFLIYDKENLIRNQELFKFAIISLILMTTFQSKTFDCSCFSNLARNYMSIFKKIL